MIEISGLTVRFGGVTPLDQMSVTFDEGTCGLIGPNGAGKTTMIDAISGFTRPRSGDVRLEETSLVGKGPSRVARAGIARSFQ